ncbi:MAG TPA: hypothetical protein DD434_07330 [Bacteroidales bacterium]|nr:hypothetical protein [Bacteroidales bacterium]
MLNYTTIKKKISVGAAPGEKYLATISRNGIMSQEQLIERISSASALAENDVLSALRALQVVITDASMNGITVQLNELGIFTPYLSAKAMLTAEEVDATTIRGVRVNFRPNVRFKNKLKTTSYEYRNPMPKGLVLPAADAPVAP